MSFGQVEGFFLDSCVLLPQSSESKTEACSTFLKEASSKCILSSSVRTEAIDLIDRAYNAIVIDFRQNLKPYLEQKKIKKLTNRHGRILETYFSERRRTLKATQPQRSNIRNEVMGTIENYVAAHLHSLKEGSTIKLDDFLAFLLMRLALVEHKLKAPFMGIRSEDIKPDDAIISLTGLRALIANPNDIRHLGSALTYQFGKNKWIIFVTNDESEILSKESEMFSIFGLQCSKPEWASDHYRELTRLKSPIEHFRETKDHPEEQREFVKVLEKVLSIKIVNQVGYSAN